MSNMIFAAQYGRFGYAPVPAGRCPYQGDNSCISRSGDSCCGGYGGHHDSAPGFVWIECIEGTSEAEEEV